MLVVASIVGKLHFQKPGLGLSGPDKPMRHSRSRGAKLTGESVQSAPGKSDRSRKHCFLVFSRYSGEHAPALAGNDVATKRSKADKCRHTKQNKARQTWRMAKVTTCSCLKRRSPRKGTMNARRRFTQSTRVWTVSTGRNRQTVAGVPATDDA